MLQFFRLFFAFSPTAFSLKKKLFTHIQLLRYSLHRFFIIISATAFWMECPPSSTFLGSSVTQELCALWRRREQHLIALITTIFLDYTVTPTHGVILTRTSNAALPTNCMQSPPEHLPVNGMELNGALLQEVSCTSSASVLYLTRE